MYINKAIDIFTKVEVTELQKSNDQQY